MFFTTCWSRWGPSGGAVRADASWQMSIRAMHASARTVRTARGAVLARRSAAAVLEDAEAVVQAGHPVDRTCVGGPDGGALSATAQGFDGAHAIAEAGVPQDARLACAGRRESLAAGSCGSCRALWCARAAVVYGEGRTGQQQGGEGERFEEVHVGMSTMGEGVPSAKGAWRVVTRCTSIQAVSGSVFRCAVEVKAPSRSMWNPRTV